MANVQFHYGQLIETPGGDVRPLRGRVKPPDQSCYKYSTANAVGRTHFIPRLFLIPGIKGLRSSPIFVALTTEKGTRPRSGRTIEPAYRTGRQGSKNVNEE